MYYKCVYAVCVCSVSVYMYCVCVCVCVCANTYPRAVCCTAGVGKIDLAWLEIWQPTPGNSSLVTLGTHPSNHLRMTGENEQSRWKGGEKKGRANEMRDMQARHRGREQQGWAVKRKTKKKNIKTREMDTEWLRMLMCHYIVIEIHLFQIVMWPSAKTNPTLSAM